MNDMSTRRLNSCCCCFTARTGALILAVLGVVVGLFSIFSNSASLVNADLTIAAYKSQENDLTRLHGEGEIDDSTYTMSKWYFDTVIEYYTTGVALSLVINVLSFLLNASLVYGIQKNKGAWMMPWVVLTLMCLVIEAMFLIVASIVIGINAGAVLGTSLAVVGIISVGIGFYFWAVVYSVYCDIQDSSSTDSQNGFGYRKDIDI